MNYIFLTIIKFVFKTAMNMTTSDWISLITAISTLGLTGFTGWYLFETRSLRKLNEKLIARDNSEIGIRIVGTKFFRINEKEFFAFGVEVINTGSKRAGLIRPMVSWSMEKNDLESLLASIQKGSPTGSSSCIHFLYPEKKGYFYCEVSKSDLGKENCFLLAVKYLDADNQAMVNEYEISLIVDRNEYQNSSLQLSKTISYKKPLEKY
ncbi:MAG: hypothetical protein V2A63_00360 [Patescibacteria group bacterium]